MDPRGYYVQQNKPGEERQITNDFINLWSIKTKQKQKEQSISVTDTEK